MAADDLDDDERELLAKHRAEKKKASQAKHDDSDIHWYERDKDGTERGASMRYSAAREHGPEWLRKHLTDEQAKDDGAEADEDAKPDNRPIHFRGSRNRAG